jgi:hypothetical protein
MVGFQSKNRRLAFPVRGPAFYRCMGFRRGAERGAKSAGLAIVMAARRQRSAANVIRFVENG